MSDGEDNTPGNEEADATSLPEALIALKTGIPPQVQKSFWKVFGRIFTAGAEIPANWLEGKAKIIKASHDAKAQDIASIQEARSLINKNSAKSASDLFSKEDNANRALAYHAAHILKEQANRENILAVAAVDIIENPPENESNGEIDDEWADIFFKEASTRSSADFQYLFGKILAGEMKKPGTFASSTVQILSRLDKSTAELFRIFCNCSTLVGRGKVISPYGHAGSNALKDFGLSYNNLSILVEAGLVRPDFAEWNDFPPAFFDRIPFDHGGHNVWLAKGPNFQEDTLPGFRISGPSFTRAGEELRSVVKMEVQDAYLAILAKWFKEKNLLLVKEISNESGVMKGSIVNPPEYTV